MNLISEIQPVCNLIVGFISTKEELIEAQKLRYDMLILDYDSSKQKNGIDSSEYDDVCDILIVKDITTNKIVGTYRFMSSEKITGDSTYISELEFDITNLKNSGKNLLELGRAVVDKEYRNGLVLKLLWQGIFEYCKKHNTKYIFGTASFHGIDCDLYKNAFSSLFYNKLVDKNLMGYAKEPFKTLNMLKENEIDMVQAKKEMPPLVKGYMALNSLTCDTCFIDYDFKSIDILVILDFEKINTGYVEKMFGVKL